MNVSPTAAAAAQPALDLAARLCLKAGREARQADQQLHYGNVPAARERLTGVDQAAQEALRALLEAGAARPSTVRAPRSETDPLRALAQADTPATRSLLELLRACVLAAEIVDLERGHVLPPDAALLPGESRGTGWAETLSSLAERLRVEVKGPTRAAGRE